MTNKEKIIDLYRQTDKKDIEDLITWLETTDYYTAPASRRYHLNYPGGLIEHSLNVYGCLEMKNKQFGEKYSKSTIIISALSHDFCKINFYKPDFETITPVQIPYLKDLSKEDWVLYRNMMEKKMLSKSLTTDLIKYYKGETKIKPNLNRVVYKIEDDFPLSHGSKSVYLLNQYIKLTSDEALAIMFHMGLFNNPKDEYIQAAKISPLVIMLSCADIESTYIIENE